MESKKPRELKAVDSWVPSKDPKIIAALKKIVKAVKQHPEEDWPRRLQARYAVCFGGPRNTFDAKMAARNASPTVPPVNPVAPSSGF